MNESISLSNTNEKLTRYENTELSSAYLDDKILRKIDAISTERIDNGITLLNTYTVKSDAISGGMGSVWRVHHNGWNTDLAMKRPQPRFFAEGSEKRKEQFVRECEFWINLGLHPNIVSCYYVREIGGVPTIFSEWMDNGSLSDRIKDGSLYEGTEDEVQKRILDIAIQSARGLQYAHENDLIHQDFKPGNLLLTKSWDAKVADFGLAKARTNLEEKSEAAKTTGYTLAYCPAEQANREDPARWMDVYAWTLTVLEMYAGKRLWQTGAEAKEHFDEYPPQCRITMPKKLPELLQACLTVRQDKNVFDIAEKALLLIYHAAVHENYPVEKPAAAGDTADSLNNRALSFLDLGKKEEALALWDKALRVKPNHFYTTYNLLTSKWYDAQVDDLTVLVRLREIDRFMNLADSKEGLRHVADCRGTDEAVKEIPFAEGQADWQASDQAEFECFDEQNHTKLVGVSPQKREHGASFGSLKLYDTRTGRCIRTVCPRLSDDAAISFGARDDNFGELRMTADGCYCYPDASHSTLYYRRPDMKSHPPVWILSRILPYSALAEKKRRLDQLIVAAEKEIDGYNIPAANKLVNEAYTLVESTENPKLNELNEKLGHFGRINGIRNYSVSTDNAIYKAMKKASRRERDASFKQYQSDSAWNLEYWGLGPTKLRTMGCCYCETLSDSGEHLYMLQTIKGERDEKLLRVVNWNTYQRIGIDLHVRGRMLRVSPDERYAVTVEYVEEPDAPIRRLLHVYSPAQQRELNTIRIPDNSTDISGGTKPLFDMMIRDMCFRHDSEAIFLLKASGALTMIDLKSGEELVLLGDLFTADSADDAHAGEQLVAIAADKDGVYCRRADDSCFMWKISYELTFKGWKKWDHRADEVLQRFAKRHPYYSDALLEEFLFELRSAGFANIYPPIAREKLKSRCAVAGVKDDIIHRRKYYRDIGILIGLLVLGILCLWRSFALRGEVDRLRDIWQKGESTEAVVEIADSYELIKKMTVTYTVGEEEYISHLKLMFSLKKPRVADNFENYDGEKARVKLRYLPDDPTVYSFKAYSSSLASSSGLWLVLFFFLLSFVLLMIYILKSDAADHKADKSKRKEATRARSGDYKL